MTTQKQREREDARRVAAFDEQTDGAPGASGLTAMKQKIGEAARRQEEENGDMSEQVRDDEGVSEALFRLTEALETAIVAYRRDAPQPNDAAIRNVLLKAIEVLAFADCTYREIALELQRAAGWALEQKDE